MNRESSKSALFLMELILAILFFALAAVVCVQLFCAAHTLSTDTRDSNCAVTLAQNAAAALQSAEGDLQAAARLLQGEADTHTLQAWYTADGKACTAAEAAFKLQASAEPLQETAAVTVLRLRDNSELFCLTVSWHAPLRAA